MRTIQEVDEKIEILKKKSIILWGLFGVYFGVLCFGFSADIGAPITRYKCAMIGAFEMPPEWEAAEEKPASSGKITVLPPGALKPIEKPDLTSHIIKLLISVILLYLLVIIIIRHVRKARERRYLLKSFQKARPILADEKGEDEIYDLLDAAIISRNKRKKTRAWFMRAIYFLIVGCIALYAFMEYRSLTGAFLDKPIIPDLQLILHAILSRLLLISSLFFLLLLEPKKDKLDAKVEVLTWVVSDPGTILQDESS
jgi:hypothetical protein